MRRIAYRPSINTLKRKESDPISKNIAEELKTKRHDDSSKLFIQEEWLSPSQIRSLFSKFVRKNTTKASSQLAMSEKETQNDEAIQQAIADTDTLEYHVDMVNTALTTEVDLSLDLFI